ncbi:MAG: CCC motif membrane protein [Candidatus Pseudobacter hemicellulosilyticus]|uniref:CCC motif membrane protein n=1 Tax=Candidatus Pseudobacter hemicellulosilyticus TaxID=3121375 RepID=A0AAJ6BEP4_9BACT|nr:MAG: CCC motif membrane protein [Pseudobacter sp.]
MENLNQPSQTPTPTQKTMLPNATVVMVLGICSIVFGCLFIGLILGIIGLVLSSKPRKMYKENPAAWDGYGQLNAGFIMSIIGIALGSIYAIYYIFMLAILGSAATSIWNMNNL